MSTHFSFIARKMSTSQKGKVALVDNHFVLHLIIGLMGVSGGHHLWKGRQNQTIWARLRQHSSLCEVLKKLFKALNSKSGTISIDPPFSMGWWGSRVAIIREKEDRTRRSEPGSGSSSSSLCEVSRRDSAKVLLLAVTKQSNRHMG